MTNQLNISYQNLNWTRFWLSCKLLLLTLIATTVFSSLNYVPSVFLIVNILLSVLLIGTFVFLTVSKMQTPFTKIETNKLQYFCPVKKELIEIPINEITHISTHFCEVEIHTTKRTHCLNLNHIKQEKQRWEIKEMIRSLSLENGKRVVNF